MLDAIYAEEGVIEEQAKEVSGGVSCVLRLQPNTGFDKNKVAVIIKAMITFSNTVSSEQT